MAKKKKSAGKPTKKQLKKPAGRAATTLKTVAPKPVKTGTGATAAQIGAAVVAHVNAGRPDKAIWDKFWSPAVISVEGAGLALAWSGRKAMEAKSDGWLKTFTVHGCSAEGPYLGASGFAIKFRMDTEDKATGKRTLAEEVGVYTVYNGKVIREEFMYGAITTLALPVQDRDPAPIGG